MPVDNGANKRQLSDVDRLIHEPARYNIMALLYVVERAEFLFVQNQIRMTPGNLSAHVSKLEAARYLLVQKKFVGKKPKTFLSLTKLGREAFGKYHAKMKMVFAAPLANRTNRP